MRRWPWKLYAVNLGLIERHGTDSSTDKKSKIHWIGFLDLNHMHVYFAEETIEVLFK